MRTLACFALTISVALLAGCGGSQSLVGAPGTMAQTRALTPHADSTNYKVVYNFAGGGDAAGPSADLIEVNGTLYGTTQYGSHCRINGAGCGTVFSVTPSGTEKVLHSFHVGFHRDGIYPGASLIEVKGKLYGTTSEGGKYLDCYSYYGCGTVFYITTSGKERVLHSFGRYVGDGNAPEASLIKVSGMLYGTTSTGGYHGGGTIFSITPSGRLEVLHSFGLTGDGDGIAPLASLIEVKGKLYGTTSLGGTCYNYYGCGTVFSITPSGRENVLHSFGTGTDGLYPQASLVELNGTLYGTTLGGGGSYDDGTVFSITPGGTEKVLHVFSGDVGGADGASPYATLINVKGTLYGTTYEGGLHDSGTVFSITPSGREKVLHSFGNGTDGAKPHAGLVDVHGTLYGTTVIGGTYGRGTVFALTP